MHKFDSLQSSKRRQLAQLMFGSIFLIRIEPKLAIAAFAGIILVAIVSMLYGDFTRVLAEKVQELFAVSSAIAESKSIETLTTTFFAS